MKNQKYDELLSEYSWKIRKDGILKASGTTSKCLTSELTDGGGKRQDEMFDP
jgi:hypothetical protein